MGGQVEVNKEMVGMVREEMRVVLCEDDLEPSQGRRKRSVGVWRQRRASQWHGEKARYPGIE